MISETQLAEQQLELAALRDELVELRDELARVGAILESNAIELHAGEKVSDGVLALSSMLERAALDVDALRRRCQGDNVRRVELFHLQELAGAGSPWACLWRKAATKYYKLSQSGTCTWCGHTGPRDEVAAHIVECIKHPMGELARQWEARLTAMEIENASLRRQVTKLQVDNQQLRGGNGRWMPN
jgi:hypothetical protein